MNSYFNFKWGRRGTHSLTNSENNSHNTPKCQNSPTFYTGQQGQSIITTAQQQEQDQSSLFSESTPSWWNQHQSGQNQHDQLQSSQELQHQQLQRCLARENERSQPTSAVTIPLTPQIVTEESQQQQQQTTQVKISKSSGDTRGGSYTSNPPIPGNNNSSGNTLVDPSPQFVTITVDGDFVDQEYGSYLSYAVSDHHTAGASSLYSATTADLTNHSISSCPPYTVEVTQCGGALYNSNSFSQYHSSLPTTSSSPNSTYNQGNGTSFILPSPLTHSNAISIETIERQHVIPHTSRVSPITIQWLLENYETAEGVSLPRSTLYYHYIRHCNGNKLDPINAASFGKLIRSVFLGLRTRRLGTRGNSKYHYYGIRLKSNSPLVDIIEDTDNATIQQQHEQNHSSNHHHACSSVNSTSHNQNNLSTHPNIHYDDTCGVLDISNTSSINTDNTRNNNSSSSEINITRNFTLPYNQNKHNGTRAVNSRRSKIPRTEQYNINSQSDNIINDTFDVQEYLGDPGRISFTFPDITVKSILPVGVQKDDILLFQRLYHEHCEILMDTVSTFNLNQVESSWKSFWRSGNSVHLNHMNDQHELEKILPEMKLHLLCTMVEVQEFIRLVDYHLYQSIVSILIPDVLRPIPSSMTQAIRNFAKVLEPWIISATVGYPSELVGVKVTTIQALSKTLRRYTSLNHVGQAARAVLQNQQYISQMLMDLKRVDFNNVKEPGTWVCGCDNEIVDDILQDFKIALEQQQTLEQLVIWLEGVVDKLLRPHLKSPKFIKFAPHFLLKWSFYSSLVIRDLTLRSASSFGSFHLLRLLYDEYIFHLVELRIAEVTGSAPIAVIGKISLDNIAYTPLTTNYPRPCRKAFIRAPEATTTDFQGGDDDIQRQIHIDQEQQETKFVPNHDLSSNLVIDSVCSLSPGSNIVHDSSRNGHCSSVVLSSLCTTSQCSTLSPNSNNKL